MEMANYSFSPDLDIMWAVEKKKTGQLSLDRALCVITWNGGEGPAHLWTYWYILSRKHNTIWQRFTDEQWTLKILHPGENKHFKWQFKNWLEEWISDFIKENICEKAG